MNHAAMLTALRSACGSKRLTALTTRQLTMLLACSEQPWLVHRLAEYLGVPLSVVSRGADPMVRAGLLVRSKDPSDKRRVWLRIGADGTDALKALEIIE